MISDKIVYAHICGILLSNIYSLVINNMDYEIYDSIQIFIMLIATPAFPLGRMITVQTSIRRIPQASLPKF
jgi:Na+-translocating ferredoxin:NAD+ oxidoreductase RnfE subunit